MLFRSQKLVRTLLFSVFFFSAFGSGQKYENKNSYQLQYRTSIDILDKKMKHT